MRVVEVGPRDGLQNLPNIVAPMLRVELIRRLAQTGLSRIEAVSFVREDRVPQMAGAAQVVTAVGAIDASLCGLVLNERGFDRLLAAGLRDARFTFAVSDAFNRVNSNSTAEAGMAAAMRLLRYSKEHGVHVGIVLATSFGCPFAGDVSWRLPLRAAERLVSAGATEIVFADTIGVAMPEQVRGLISRARNLPATLGVHLHDTNCLGYANAYAAVEEGVDIIDASIGGMGGCPSAPQAAGNIATENVIALLEHRGVKTGVDPDALAATACWLRDLGGLGLGGQKHIYDRVGSRSQ